eukprot:scaffold13006_cov32-Phaeocystis_antarctica.AAC.1
MGARVWAAVEEGVDVLMRLVPRQKRCSGGGRGAHLGGCGAGGRCLWTVGRGRGGSGYSLRGIGNSQVPKEAGSCMP